MDIYAIVFAPFIEKLSFPPWNCLGALAENQPSLYTRAYFRTPGPSAHPGVHPWADAALSRFR